MSLGQWHACRTRHRHTHACAARGHTCSPNPPFSTACALTGWSPKTGMHSSGLPAARPSLMLFLPACVTNTRTAGWHSTAVCGTQLSTSTLSGALPGGRCCCCTSCNRAASAGRQRQQQPASGTASTAGADAAAAAAAASATTPATSDGRSPTICDAAAAMSAADSAWLMLLLMSTPLLLPKPCCWCWCCCCLCLFWCLFSHTHTHTQEVTAAKASMLPAINRMLDVQVASFGIHPGRTGLSNVELLAAMKMLR